MNIPLNLRIPEDVKAKLKALADADGRTMTNYLIKLIKEAK